MQVKEEEPETEAKAWQGGRGRGRREEKRVRVEGERRPGTGSLPAAEPRHLANRNSKEEKQP